MLASQTHARLEVVLVAHGVPLSAIPREFERTLNASGITMNAIEVAGDVPFGTALSAGAARAEGRYVTKVDDDDFYGPEHVTDLLVAAAHSGADLVGKALQYVYLEPLDTSVRLDGRGSVSTPETYTDWVCGGTLMLERSLGEHLRWFDPLPSAVDRNLQDKVLRARGRIYRTHGLGYVYARRRAGHTYHTQWTKYLSSATEQRPGVWEGRGFALAPETVAAS